METTRTKYHFCPSCREKGRTRRISADQALEHGVCDECLAERGQKAIEEENDVTKATVEQGKRGPGRPRKAATPAVAGRAVKKPKGQLCECGCGGMTKGGKFIPGHDAKLHNKVKKGMTIEQARAANLAEAKEAAKK